MKLVELLCVTVTRTWYLWVCCCRLWLGGGWRAGRTGCKVCRLGYEAAGRQVLSLQPRQKLLGRHEFGSRQFAQQPLLLALQLGQHEEYLGHGGELGPLRECARPGSRETTETGWRGPQHCFTCGGLAWAHLVPPPPSPDTATTPGR